MHYFDTSFLAPLILPESASGPVTNFFKGLSVNSLAISHWTLVEFASLIAREVRMGSLKTGSARDAVLRFEMMVSESFVILLPNCDDFDCARDFLGNFESGLRSGDALHLAIASNRRVETIYSLDKLMISAGKEMGLPTSAGITLSGYDD